MESLSERGFCRERKWKWACVCLFVEREKEGKE
jgi:hypothetical protein